jgi:hypothetical protein
MSTHPGYPLLMTEHHKMRLAGEELSPLPDVSDSRLLQTLVQPLVPVIDGQAGNNKIVGRAPAESRLEDRVPTLTCRRESRGSHTASTSFSSYARPDVFGPHCGADNPAGSSTSRCGRRARGPVPKDRWEESIRTACRSANPTPWTICWLCAIVSGVESSPRQTRCLLLTYGALLRTTQANEVGAQLPEGL